MSGEFRIPVTTAPGLLEGLKAWATGGCVRPVCFELRYDPGSRAALKTGPKMDITVTLIPPADVNSEDIGADWLPATDGTDGYSLHTYKKFCKRPEGDCCFQGVLNTPGKSKHMTKVFRSYVESYDGPVESLEELKARLPKNSPSYHNIKKLCQEKEKNESCFHEALAEAYHRCAAILTRKLERTWSMSFVNEDETEGLVGTREHVEKSEWDDFMDLAMCDEDLFEEEMSERNEFSFRCTPGQITNLLRRSLVDGEYHEGDLETSKLIVIKTLLSLQVVKILKEKTRLRLVYTMVKTRQFVEEKPCAASTRGLLIFEDNENQDVRMMAVIDGIVRNEREKPSVVLKPINDVSMSRKEVKRKLDKMAGTSDSEEDIDSEEEEEYEVKEEEDEAGPSLEKKIKVEVEDLPNDETGEKEASDNDTASWVTDDGGPPARRSGRRKLRK